MDPNDVDVEGMEEDGRMEGWRNDSCRRRKGAGHEYIKIIIEFHKKITTIVYFYFTFLNLAYN